ncbi:hypothetical protein [Nocardia sp. NPDC057353]|uniref:phthiocerol/phthiodiolone dimycocerosyl transferase family protein n=1 Tax=Nocardia sp. NPDC057353 TaxID=3346104 RepID=UPI003626B9B0
MLDLARGIGAMLDAGLSAGIIQQGPLRAAETPIDSEDTLLPPGMVFATNVGIVPVPSTPPGLRITDFCITMVHDAERVTARKLGALGDGAVFFYTFDGRLSIEAADSPAVIGEIGATLYATIRAAESKLSSAG